MTFLNNNLNKPKLNGIKKPTIKMPKLEPKKEIIKPAETAKPIEEVKTKPEFKEIVFIQDEEAKETNNEIEEVKEEVEEKAEIKEEQQSFDDFKTLEETESKEEEIKTESAKEVEPEVVEEKPETTEEKAEEHETKEEKPKKKTRKRTTKAKKEESAVVETISETEAGSNDLEFIESNISEIINPTTPAWEEEKVIVNSKMDEIMIDSDMTSADMDEILAKLSHLENDVRQRLDEISPLYFNVKDLIDYIETTAGTGSTATERKAAGKVICTRYVKEPGAAPVNLYTLFNFQRARYDFYKSKMEQIKNENGRLITLSAVKKIECSLSR